jgi:hypothetical protein
MAKRGMFQIAPTREVAVKDRVTELAREVLGPYLSARGFRRNGRTFWRNGADVCQIITLSMSRWGTKATSDFDVFLGVFWHDVEKVLGNPSSERMPPPEYRCTFRIDLGWTTPKRLQRSWKVDLTSDLSKLGNEVMKDVANFGLPWLDYRSNLRHALDAKRYLKPDGDGGYTSHEMLSDDARLVFMLKCGKVEQARKELAARLANGSRASEIRAFAKRLGMKW